MAPAAGWHARTAPAAPSSARERVPHPNGAGPCSRTAYRPRAKGPGRYGPTPSSFSRIPRRYSPQYVEGATESPHRILASLTPLPDREEVGHPLLPVLPAQRENDEVAGPSARGNPSLTKSGCVCAACHRRAVGLWRLPKCPAAAASRTIRSVRMRGTDHHAPVEHSISMLTE
ncbi:hypothetical protein T261_7746 [Streptomyces lydicus]|nr:hypothetical protein T261_7746 [Streptomyces lydicus]